MLYILPLVLSLQMCAFSISSAAGITRNDLNSAHKIVNGSASTGHPHPQFFYPQTHPHQTTVESDDRNPRQWLSGGYGGYGGYGGWRSEIARSDKTTGKLSTMVIDIMNQLTNALEKYEKVNEKVDKSSVKESTEAPKVHRRRR